MDPSEEIKMVLETIGQTFFGARGVSMGTLHPTTVDSVDVYQEGTED